MTVLASNTPGDELASPSPAIERRIDELLSRMTVAEKVGQLNQMLYGWQCYQRVGDRFELTETFKQTAAQFGGIGAIYGLLRADPWSNVNVDNGIPGPRAAEVVDMVQDYLARHTRLGIPALIASECVHGHMAIDGTLLPVNLGAGATWNPRLYQQAMTQVGAELAAAGVDLGYVTVMDVLRDPRWGRSEECYSEDPHLVSCFAQATVRGLQSNPGIAAVAKVLAAHGEGRGGRNQGPAAIGPRELHEIHLPPAEAAIQAGAWSVMAAYNEIDGIPCHANATLTNGILRERWGFRGFVMSDARGIDRLIEQGAETPTAAAALALRCGIDMNLGDIAFTILEAALQQGLINETMLNRAARRVLRVKFALGLPRNQNDARPKFDAAALRQTSLQLARQSMVLLKNEGDLLPWRTLPRRLAVIGPNADVLENQLGDYSAPQRPGSGVTVWQGLQQLASDRCELRYARGCSLRGNDTSGFDEALETAAASDAVVLVLGGSSARTWGDNTADNGSATDLAGEMDCGEGLDVADLELGGVQVQLAQRIAALGKPWVVVLIQGRPHAIPWIAAHCPAILCAWYPGPQGGLAVAETLLGLNNPGGKLPVSIPRSSAQLPVCYNRKIVLRQKDYRDSPSEPLFNFGHGLSYSRFHYHHIAAKPQALTATRIEKGETFNIRVELENVSEVAGDEVVQVYVRRHGGSITPRCRELKAFERVHLEPGRRSTVEFALGRQELAVWDVEMQHVVEAGRIELQIGGDPAALTSIPVVIKP